MESASLLSRESTTLSFAKPQKGHFMGLGNSSHCNRQRKWTLRSQRVPSASVTGTCGRLGTSSSGGWRRGGRHADLLLLAALFRQLCERKPLTMSQQQAEWNHGNECHQPQHDSATGS